MLGYGTTLSAQKNPVQAFARSGSSATAVAEADAPDANGPQAEDFSTGITAVIASAMANAATPTIEEISRHMQSMNSERIAALVGYESQRTYRLQYTGFGGGRTAELVARANYAQPNQMHLTVVSESGSKVLCDEALRRLIASEEEATQTRNRATMALNLENYTMRLVGRELVGDQPAYVLDVSPRVASKYTYRGRVWVSATDYAVMRIKGEPAVNPSFWVKRASFQSDFKKMGQVWVPQQNVSESNVRFGGRATLTIDYGNYNVLTTKPLHPEVRGAVGQ